MSRLLKPSPGECADRQTILQIKMRVAEKKAAPLEHFVAENNDIQRYLEAEWFPDLLAKEGAEGGEKFDAMMFELEKVNQSLWDLEDEIRSLMVVVQSDIVVKRDKVNASNPIMIRIMEVAFNIPVQNDRRAAAVENINLLFGIKTREKIYSEVMTTLQRMEETVPKEF